MGKHSLITKLMKLTTDLATFKLASENMFFKLTITLSIIFHYSVGYQYSTKKVPEVLLLDSTSVCVIRTQS